MNQIFKNITINEIASIIAVVTFAYTIYNFTRKFLIKKKKQKDISDFVTEEKLKSYEKGYIRTQCVDRPPDIEDEPRESYEHANRQDLISFFKNQVFTSSSKKIYLILAGAGMGKTTFLINLFLEYNSKLFTQNYKIKFVSLSDKHSDEYIEKYKKDGSDYDDGSNTILLLDAFDEDPNALDNYDSRLNQIIQKTKNYRKIIITSRTHFFPEESKEKFSSKYPIDDGKEGYRTFIKKYIAPFSDEEIKRFLRKNYGFRIRILNNYLYINNTRKEIEKIVALATNLVVRPMLLEQIELILKSDIKFTNEYDVYNALIIEWIKRESKKQPNNTSENFILEMNTFLEVAAIHIYNNFMQKKGLYIDIDNLESIAQSNHIKLSKIDMTSRSLLNRTPKGKYKFSHKSILEFILAKIDANTYDKSKFFNFEPFDFGILLRNQILIEHLGSKNKQVFVKEIEDKFYPLNTNRTELFDEIETVFITNSNEIEIRKLRIFKNLKRIFFYPNLNYYNLNKIEISSKNNISIGGASKFIYIKSEEISLKIDSIIYQLKDELYFNKKGVEVYKLKKKVANNV